MRAALAALAALLAGSAAAAPRPVTPPALPPSMSPATAEAVRLIDAWADAALVYGRWPAYSIAIGERGRLVWSKGYGHVDADRRVPARGDTIYSICSISKLFTAVAVMQQWEAGRLRLDEPITTYLPWAAHRPDGRDAIPVTLRTLLTHSAGVQRDSESGSWTGPDFRFPTRAELQAEIGRQPPLYPAGRFYQYSNIGISLAGEAAASVAGRDYAGLVTSSIIEPLGLADTRPDHPYHLIGTRMALGWSPLARDGSRTPLARFDARAITPAAGFTSTAEDLVRFGLWQLDLLKQDVLPARPGVLRPSTLKEMQRVQFVDPPTGTSLGLGFFSEVDGEGHVVGHDGSCPGYHTTLLIRPESDTAVAVMTTDNHEVWADTVQVHRLLDARRQHQFKGPAAAIVPLEDYAGRYVSGVWDSETIILPWNGGLVTLSLPEAEPAAHLGFLKPVAPDRFRRIAPDGSAMHEVIFQRDTSGRVVAKQEFFQRSRREPPPEL